MERENFEKSWKNAFEGAGIEPGASVWTGIELDLEKAQGGKMKKRLLMYKLLAAASMVFALGVSGVYMLSVQHADKQQPTTNSATSGNNNQLQTDANTGSESKQDKEILFKEPTKSEQAKPDHQRGVPDLSGTTLQTSVLVSSSDLQEQTEKKSNAATVQRNEPLLKVRQPGPFFRLDNPTLKISSHEVTADPGMVLLARLKDEERKLLNEDKKKEVEEKVWTSLGMGAGSYNPDVSSSNSAATLGGSSGDPTSGMSYSLGVSVGGRLSKRIILQGGVSYLSQNASFTSSAVSMEAVSARASLNEFADNSAYVVASSPYGVTSNLQYVSLPVQVGYMILDRNFAIQLNGGVATDFFVQNTLTPETDQVAKVSQGPGQDSPYRIVNFNGLVGTELSYKFGKHYRLALNPGLRYALNSIYKPEVNVQISPITYDVALRFKYIFR